jgi:hypothetical protein
VATVTELVLAGSTHWTPLLRALHPVVVIAGAAVGGVVVSCMDEDDVEGGAPDDPQALKRILAMPSTPRSPIGRRLLISAAPTSDRPDPSAMNRVDIA